MTKAKDKSSLDAWTERAFRYPLLSPEETLLLSGKVQDLAEDDPKRNKLVNKLVKHNLRLVIFITERYMSCGRSGRTWGCPETVDFLQEGAIGLKRAAELYDPRRGYSFSTYASYWIRNKVTRCASKARALVYVSESMSSKIVSYNKNGYLKCRKTGKILDDDKIRPLILEATLALSCSSLSFLDENGEEMAVDIPDNSSDEADQDLYAGVGDMLTAAGVSDLDKEILMLQYGHGNSQKETAARLGISQKMVKRHTVKALACARGSKELAALV